MLGLAVPFAQDERGARLLPVDPVEPCRSVDAQGPGGLVELETVEVLADGELVGVVVDGVRDLDGVVAEVRVVGVCPSVLHGDVEDALGGGNFVEPADGEQFVEHAVPHEVALEPQHGGEPGGECVGVVGVEERAEVRDDAFLLGPAFELGEPAQYPGEFGVEMTVQQVVAVRTLGYLCGDQRHHVLEHPDAGVQFRDGLGAVAAVVPVHPEDAVVVGDHGYAGGAQIGERGEGLVLADLQIVPEAEPVLFDELAAVELHRVERPVDAGGEDIGLLLALLVHGG